MVNWEEQFKNEGYAVIPQTLSEDEVKRARELFWQWLEMLESGIEPDNPETWRNLFWPGDTQRGFICSHGISQSEFAWYVRAQSKIKEVFSQIWKNSDLVCSMDAVICWRPWWLSPKNERWKPRVEGLHTDQNPNNKPGFHCVQGMVPLFDVTPETGGLAVIPGSHINEMQKRLSPLFPKHRGDWCELDPDDLQMININKEPQLIEARAGDLIIWDSRLLHCGQVGKGPMNQTNKIELARLSVPICMMPRNRIPEKIQKRRREIFAMKKTLTHWPDKCEITDIEDFWGRLINENAVSNYELTDLEKELL